jgi:hypothetical protein
VIRPITAIVVKMPREKSVANQKALLVDTLPCSPIKAMIKGILDKWQGLNNMLNIPHKREAVKAIIRLDSSEVESHPKIVVIII